MEEAGRDVEDGIGLVYGSSLFRFGSAEANGSNGFRADVVQERAC